LELNFEDSFAKGNSVLKRSNNLSYNYIMDYQALKDEIQNDPDILGYAGKSNYEIVELLNGNGYTKQVPIPISELMIWGATTQTIVDISDGALAVNTDKSSRAICMAIARLFDNPNDQTLDVSNPAIILMLDGLVAAAIITEAHKNSLLALADKSASRAENLFEQNVSINDVRSALAL
jgi:hypothetical protein